MISLTKDKSLLGYELLNSYSNISHFVTTRHGGCGEGAYGTFNCSPFTGDSSRMVHANQFALLQSLKHEVKDLVLPMQQHGTVSLVISEEFYKNSLGVRWALLHGKDALITDMPGVCICVSTADCVPVLLYDKRLQVVASVHAGWRGTVQNISGNVLEHMNINFGTEAEDVIACIGPSISLESFEVGEEVYETFWEAGYNMPRISDWNKKTGKHHIDLWETNRIQLTNCGVPAEQIEVAGICTYKNHEDFFSARRLGIDSGRMLSGIMIREHGK